jgi:phosphate-selective porin OprO/OprP
MFTSHTILFSNILLTGLLCLITSIFSHAQVLKDSATVDNPVQKPNVNHDSILIKNTYLIGRQGTGTDVLISVFIIDGILKFITRDNVPIQPSTLTLDAEKGFLFGNLVIGTPPSFVVLDQNPRENFDIFLNSANHVRFAMEKGKLVKNDLPIVSVAPDQSKPKQSGWAAYAPPPMAVPLSYYDSRKWNKFETKFISGLFNGALVLDHLNWLTQDDNSKTQVGDLSSSSIGEIRGLRYGVIGTLNFKRPWIYTVFIASNTFSRGYDQSTDSRFQLYDLRLDIPLTSKTNLSIGKQKEPISMERLTSLIFLPMQERAAAADAFLPIRNYGAVLNGTAFGNRASWATGIFKNWVDSKESWANTSSQLTTRITGIPFLSKDESNMLHLSAAVRYIDSRQDIIGKTEAEFYQAPVFVETLRFPANHVVTYDLEAFWRKGPYLVGFEYIGTDVTSSDYNNPFVNGYNISGSWILTGEMRPYRKRSGIFDPVPVSRPVNNGGWGALELAARYSTIDLVDDFIDGGEMDTYSLGLNWWPSSLVQFSGNYRYISLQRYGITGLSSGLNFRLILILN